MNLEHLLGALRSARPDGVAVGAWSVCVTRLNRIVLGTRDRETGNAHSPLSLSESLGARYLIVWQDGKISRGSLEKRQIMEEAREAWILARAAAYEDPDAAQVRGPADFPDVDLHDDRVARLVEGETGILEKRLARIRERLGRSGFRTWSGSFSASDARTRLVTSAGLEVEGVGTSAGWHVSFEGECGDGFNARSLESEEEFERRLERLAETVGLLKRTAAPMAPGVHPVILHPHVVEEFVIGSLLHNLDGATVAHHEGHFRKAQFGGGEPVLREDVTLRLDPLRPLRAGSYRFTAEGVPAAPCSYIRGGRLVSPILDLKYASRLGMEPTPVPYGMDALHLEASDTLTTAAAYASAAPGALVLSVLGVHTQDPSSGDFSLSAPQALRLGPDGPEGRIKTTISGNLWNLLASPDFRLVGFPGEHTPGLLFPCRIDPT